MVELGGEKLEEDCLILYISVSSRMSYPLMGLIIQYFYGLISNMIEESFHDVHGGVLSIIQYKVSKWRVGTGVN